MLTSNDDRSARTDSRILLDGTSTQPGGAGRRRHELFISSVALIVIGMCTLAGLLTADDQKPAAKQTEWKSLFDGETLTNWKQSNFGGEGEVEVDDGVIVMRQGSDITGITWTGDKLPQMNYEVSIMAKRIDGNDFFCGLTFEVNEDPCSLIIGGWGGGLVGISSLNGLDAANNETARFESFDRKKWYNIRLRVTEIGLMAWIDDKQVVSVATKGKKISIRSEVEASRPFGISCFATTAGLKDIKVRKLTADEAIAPLTPADDNTKKPTKK
jgi:hypothetical protein